MVTLLTLKPLPSNDESATSTPPTPVPLLSLTDTVYVAEPLSKSDETPAMLTVVPDTGTTTLLDTEPAVTVTVMSRWALLTPTDRVAVAVPLAPVTDAAFCNTPESAENLTGSSATPLLELFFTKAVIVTDASEPEGNETAEDRTSMLLVDDTTGTTILLETVPTTTVTVILRGVLSVPADKTAVARPNAPPVTAPVPVDVDAPVKVPESVLKVTGSPETPVPAAFLTSAVMVTVALVAPAAVEMFAADDVNVMLVAVDVEPDPVPGSVVPTPPPPPQAASMATNPAPAKNFINRIGLSSLYICL